MEHLTEKETNERINIGPQNYTSYSGRGSKHICFIAYLID